MRVVGFIDFLDHSDVYDRADQLVPSPVLPSARREKQNYRKKERKKERKEHAMPRAPTSNKRTNLSLVSTHFAFETRKRK